MQKVDPKVVKHIMHFYNDDEFDIVWLEKFLTDKSFNLKVKKEFKLRKTAEPLGDSEGSKQSSNSLLKSLGYNGEESKNGS